MPFSKGSRMCPGIKYVSLQSSRLRSIQILHDRIAFYPSLSPNPCWAQLLTNRVQLGVHGVVSHAGASLPAIRDHHRRDKRGGYGMERLFHSGDDG